MTRFLLVCVALSSIWSTLLLLSVDHYYVPSWIYQIVEWIVQMPPLRSFFAVGRETTLLASAPWIATAAVAALRGIYRALP